MNFDVSYLSIDSVQEGVGSSQIQSLLFQLAKSDLSLNLVTFEKSTPSTALVEQFKSKGISWTPLPFNGSGIISGINRVSRLLKEIPESKVIHCRSDLPSFAGLLANNGPVLWDVRSLWRDQRKQMNPRQVNPIVNFSLRKIEKHVATNALGMNTLTRAVVPVLKERCKSLPNFQSVIPTSVDLERFRLTPFPKGRIRMLISGNLNQNYDIQLLNELISAFKTQLNLEVVWASDVAASIQDPIYDLKVSVNHEEMPELIASCHFGVALLQKSGKESLAAAMPTKIAEFLAIGRPVIVSSEVGDFDQMLHDRRAGLTLSSNKDLIFIIQEMAQLLSDPKTSSMCRDLAEKYFSLATSATKYIDLYSKLMCNTDRESN